MKNPRPIIAACCYVFDVTAEEIMGRKRTKHICAARHAAMTFVAEYMNWGPSRTARYFRFNHSSVLWASQRIKDAEWTGDEYAEDFKRARIVCGNRSTAFGQAKAELTAELQHLQNARRFAQTP